MLAVALGMYMLGLTVAPLPGDAKYDIHPGFSTTINPVGSIVAVRFVFHLCLLLPLANNHIIYAYCLCDLRYTMQLYLVYGNVPYG